MIFIILNAAQQPYGPTLRGRIQPQQLPINATILPQRDPFRATYTPGVSMNVLEDLCAQCMSQTAANAICEAIRRFRIPLNDSDLIHIFDQISTAFNLGDKAFVIAQRRIYEELCAQFS